MPALLLSVANFFFSLGDPFVLTIISVLDLIALTSVFFCQRVSYRTIWRLRCRTITILCQVMDGLPFSLFTSFDVYVDVVVAASTRHASHATNQNVWMYHTLPFHWVVQQLMSTNDNDWPFYVFDPIEALFTYFTFCFYAPKIKDIQLSTNYRCY